MDPLWAKKRKGPWLSPNPKGLMDYQITVRYGKKSQRYFTVPISADDARSALHQAADTIPEEVIPEVDLVELRHAPDFDKVFPDSDQASDPE